ncbi:hypothetical protein [Massilia aquatica]|uniref:Uncharacterized protein n=1 Tax=Massilia aquatica TaxID=2609000 RepID=A0ABX0M951_9BURK|nr:hypothetical protein [Massilia aquatica]NHZ43700.1 hypothetical protein [Massilia aquatica]
MAPFQIVPQPVHGARKKHARRVLYCHPECFSLVALPHASLLQRAIAAAVVAFLTPDKVSLTLKNIE